MPEIKGEIKPASDTLTVDENMRKLRKLNKMATKVIVPDVKEMEPFIMQVQLRMIEKELTTEKLLDDMFGYSTSLRAKSLYLIITKLVGKDYSR